ncbi:MAG: hypothetical protein QXO84_01630 [Candidatus Aenigmatarchaeota archaeon]
MKIEIMQTIRKYRVKKATGKKNRLYMKKLVEFMAVQIVLSKAISIDSHLYKIL